MKGFGFYLRFGREFELSSESGDFLLRLGRRVFYWSRSFGWSTENER